MNIKDKVKQQITEQVNTGQIVNYNNKQYKIVHVYTQPVNDPSLQQTLPSDPTKYPVYALQDTTNPDNVTIVSKETQQQFGG